MTSFNICGPHEPWIPTLECDEHVLFEHFLSYALHASRVFSYAKAAFYILAQIT
jgi:hypothetical protein